MKKVIMQDKELLALRANLHTHSTNSDGKFTPQELIARYRKEGYDVLAFTDHRTVNRVSEYDPQGMTLISGIELHPMGPRSIIWHLLALGVPEDFSCTRPETAQQAIRSVQEAGGIVFCAHPYWCGFTAPEVMALDGIVGIEVYNTSTRYIGKEYNMMIWDEMLDAGKNYTALAVDDIHREHDLFRGWTVICAESTEKDYILNALKNGSFYASQGPEFKSIRFHDGIFEAEFTSCCAAVLVSNKASGRCASIEAPEGPGTYTEATSMRFDLHTCAPGTYFRCQLRDSAGRMAWSNPFRIGS